MCSFCFRFSLAAEFEVVVAMEVCDINSSSLKPLKRRKEFYDANDSFIIRLPSVLRVSGELEFHIGKGIFNRSDKFPNWAGNEVLARMQRKYCFDPKATTSRDEMMKSPSLHETVPNVSPSSFGSSKDLLPRKRPMNDSTFRTEDISNHASSNLRNRNISQYDWSAQMESRNNWRSSQMHPINTLSPNKHSTNTFGMQNDSDYIPYPSKKSATYFEVEESTQKNRGSYFHPANNKIHEGNEIFTGSLARSESFNDFSNHLSSYKQKKEAQNEYKLETPEKNERLQKSQEKEAQNVCRLKKPEKKEMPQKIKGSKLFSTLPVYPNEMSLISMLRSRSPKGIIFCFLNSHSRFLHNMPQCLPANVHLVIYFNRLYKFPLFLSAAIQQLHKTECLHLHPNSNCYRNFSQDYFLNTVNRAHTELHQSIIFIILADNTSKVTGLIHRIVNSGRNAFGFKPNFDFSDFYSVLKKCLPISSLS